MLEGGEADDSRFVSHIPAHAALLEGLDTSHVVKIQRDFSQARAYPEIRQESAKHNRRLRRMRGRQKDRVRDAQHKFSTSFVGSHPGFSFVFEELTNLRLNTGERTGDSTAN